MGAGAGLASGERMQPRPSMAVLLDHVSRHGLADPVLATGALVATLRMLAERLHDEEAAALARTLPPELQRLVEETEHDVDFDAFEGYRRIARALAVPSDDARARADIVMRGIGELIGGDLVTRLEAALPERLTRTLRPVEHDIPSRSSGVWRTLSSYHPSR